MAIFTKAAHLALVVNDSQDNSKKMLVVITRGDGSYGFLGGKHDPTDSCMRHTLRREVEEEIGLSLSAGTYACAAHVMSSPVSDKIKDIFFYLDSGLTTEDVMGGAISVPNREVLGINFFPVDDKVALDGLRKGNLVAGMKEQLDVLRKYYL